MKPCPGTAVPGKSTLGVVGGRTILSSAAIALLVVGCGSSDSGGGAAPDGGAGASSGGSAGATGGSGGAAGSGGASGSAGAAGAVSGCGDATLGTGSQTIQIDSDGMQRSYILYVPKGYDASKAAPLVLNFHGYGSNALQEQAWTGMDATADANGFVVAYPEGVNNSWNAGTCCQSTGPKTDDVAFARAVVADIESRACIDHKRVFATGMSNGGYLSHLLGCEAADLFAAVAPVAGVLGIPAAQCKPSRPIPIIHFHGTADTLVPYDGSAVDPSVPDTFKGWADRDGCTGTPEQTLQHGSATCQTYKTCSAGVEVSLCTLTGEGHCWPGQTFCPYGAGTADLSANDEMWKFFENFALP